MTAKVAQRVRDRGRVPPRPPPYSSIAVSSSMLMAQKSVEHVYTSAPRQVSIPSLATHTHPTVEGFLAFLLLGFDFLHFFSRSPPPPPCAGFVPAPPPPRPRPACMPGSCHPARQTRAHGDCNFCAALGRGRGGGGANGVWCCLGPLP